MCNFSLVGRSVARSLVPPSLGLRVSWLHSGSFVPRSGDFFRYSGPRSLSTLRAWLAFVRFSRWVARVRSLGAVVPCGGVRVFPVPALPAHAGGGAVNSGALFGSVLSLSSVPAGSCPVAVSLSRFRWPVRSAVFVSVLLAFWSSPAGVRSLPASVAVPFFRAGLASLGFSGDISGRGVVARFLRDFGRFSVPAGVPSFSFFSRSAVFSALSSLARCLDWLRSRGGCPPALRPVLASLLGALWCFCPAVRG